jgi:hypothetical protein
MTDQPTPSRRAGLHDEIVRALGQIKTIPPVAHRREQADHVLELLYREWPWLRAEADDPPLRDQLAAAIRALGKSETELAALRQVARGYCPNCGRGDAAPSVEDWERERQRADSAEEGARRALAQRQEMAEERYAWQQRGDRAEAALARVGDLQERWLKAGPPPLGVSMSRWWDARLIELQAALNTPEPTP